MKHINFSSNSFALSSLVFNCHHMILNSDMIKSETGSRNISTPPSNSFVFTGSAINYILANF